MGEKQVGPVRDEAPLLLKKVAIQQKLNTQVPLNLTFRDETGKTVQLGDYFGKRPVILALVYYQCKMLCPEEINGLVGALEMVKFNPGKDFDIVFVSIDPTETPEMAAKEKALYVKRYGRPETAAGWHFLTGQQPAITALAKAVGFGFTRVPGPGWQDDPVRSCQRDRAADARGQALAVLPGRRVFAPGSAARPGRGFGRTRSDRRSTTFLPTAIATIRF